MKTETFHASNRREFLKNALLSSAFLYTVPSLASCALSDDPGSIYMDLHVHLSNALTIEQAVKISEQRNIKFGIVEHPAPNGMLGNDEDLKKYIDMLRKYPVYVGIQPVFRNWSKMFSPDLLKKLDYVLMDPQTIPQDDGSFLRIWQLDAYVDDKEKFMERYMEHSLGILNNEPISIFGWPLSLPQSIGRDYYELWTPERKQAIIDAAKAHNIAIEINDMARVPDENFILTAKNQGLKFSFGSDSRNNNAGRLTYGMEMVKKCGLTKTDLFIPGS